MAVDDSTISAGGVGIDLGFAVATLDDTTISGALNGARADVESTLNLDDVIITGRGPTPDQAFGVFYGTGSGGVLDDVAISGFSDTAPDSVSCGVAITSDAGEVALNDVSFPSPGNDQDICDPVTVSAASQQRSDAAAAAREDPVAAAMTSADTSTAVDSVATVSPTFSSDGTAQPASESAKKKDGKKGKDKHKSKHKQGKDKDNVYAQGKGKHRGKPRG